MATAFAVAGAGCGGSSGGSDGEKPGGIDGALPIQGGAGGAGKGGSSGAVGSGGATSLPGSGGIVATGGAGVDGGTNHDASPPACGQPGTPCCAASACNNDGCCVSGICMAPGGACVGLGGGICNAGACGSCGGPGLPCCTGSTGVGVCTAPTTICSAGNCSKCGELGTPCCASATGTGTCNSANAVCNGGVCMACGIPGSPCCPGSACASPGCCYDGLCKAEGTACSATAGTCQAGRCSGCGNATQPCCNNTCYDGLLCKAGSCTSCGGLTQPCCPTGSAPSCQAGMACTSSSDGVCARCGALGDMCCAGNTCADGCCSNGRCLAASACAPPDGGGPPDAPMGTGGIPGTGGRGGTGGTTAIGSGGSVGSGGVTGTGGIVTGTGGVVGSGGITTGTGGITTGTGGVTTGTGGTTTPWTGPPGCGDGVIVAPERCDDGNTLPFDGCSSECQNEPVCNGAGPCTSRCGDGIVLGEECDDGNTADGDGCSSTCSLEPNYTCAQPALGNKLLVPVVYRDFRYHNPTDFEPTVTGSETASPGMVDAALDSDGKPVYTGKTGVAIKVASKDTFATWYRNTATSHASPGMLALWDNGAGAYVNRWGQNGEPWPITKDALWCGTAGYEVKDTDGNPIPCTYELYGERILTDCDDMAALGYPLVKCTNSSGSYRGTYLMENADGNPVFFPVDSDPFTPASELGNATIPPLYTGGVATWPSDKDSAGNLRKHNFSFTSEIRYWFTYDADKSYKLAITGDDDVWVFINKQLAVDLGGIHTPVQGSVTIDSTTATTFGLEAGKVYEVAVFQAERQSNSSTFKITLSGFNTAPSICVPN